MVALQADVYVAPSVPAARPDGGTAAWSPIACTLIRGEKEAVLIDTAITKEQNNALADWIESLIPHKNLTTIYITHGHGDHFMGISILQARFPGVRAVATASTVSHMKSQVSPAFFAAFWGSLFPGDQIAQPVAIAEPLPPSNTFFLEGHALHAIECGHTDTLDTTVLHIPDLDLVVAGDVAYGDVHAFLREANTPAKRAAWVAALDKVQALHPAVVVPGHKRQGAVDGPWCLAHTKQYILDFQAALDAGAKDAKELYAAMMQKHGARLNSPVLYASCVSAFTGKAW